MILPTDLCFNLYNQNTNSQNVNSLEKYNGLIPFKPNGLVTLAGDKTHILVNKARVAYTK